MSIEWKQYAYTVKQLREKLAEFPDDTPIVMSRDAEGNGYSPLSGAWPAQYRAERTWSGEILAEGDEWNPDDYDGENYADYLEGSDYVVLLGPVN